MAPQPYGPVPVADVPQAPLPLPPRLMPSCRPDIDIKQIQDKDSVKEREGDLEPSEDFDVNFDTHSG